MRLLLLSAFIATLTLDVTCAVNDDINNWVLNAVFSEGTSASTESPDETNGMINKFGSTQSGLDTSVTCVTAEKQSGVCVFYYQCNTTRNTVIKDGAGLLDSRSADCPQFQKCCTVTDIWIGTMNKTKQNTSLEMSSNRNKDQKFVPAGVSTTTGTVTTNGKPNIPECGWSNPGAADSIRESIDTDVNDKNGSALLGDFPWMVALLRKTGSTVWSQGDYLGGGTLIHPSVVMTAIHKLETRRKNFQPNEIKCRAGEWDTQTEEELYEHQERDAANFIKHENYFRTSLYNDIALIILEKPFDSDVPHIGIGCLASSLPPSGRVCYSMGWGRNDPQNRKKYAHTLKKVPLTPVESDTCQELLRKTRLGPFFKVDVSLMCAAGSTGVDSCRGDGGAPLVCAVSNDRTELRYQVYGIVAYGIDCFNPNIPGVYANTVHLKSWVDAKMQQQGFDTKYYTI